MAELLEDIGHNVRRFREEKGWNQTELGFHADTSPSIISLIENGKRNPSTATLAKIARALGVEVVDLFPKASHRSSPEAPEEVQDEERRAKARLRPLALLAEREAERWEQAVREGAVDARLFREVLARRRDMLEALDRVLLELAEEERLNLEDQSSRPARRVSYYIKRHFVRWYTAAKDLELAFRENLTRNELQDVQEPYDERGEHPVERLLRKAS